MHVLPLYKLGETEMNLLKELAGKQRKRMVQLVFLALFSGLAIIGQAYLFVSIVDRVFLKGISLADVLPLIYSLLLVLLIRTALNYLNGRTGIVMAATAKGELRHSLLSRYSEEPVQSAIKGQSGRKVSVMMDTVDEVDSYFSSYLPQLILSSVVPVMLLIAIFLEHYTTAIIMLVTAPFIPIFMIIIGFRTKDKSEEQLDKMAAFSGTFLDTLQGLETLKLFGQSKRQKEKIRESSLEFRDATMKVLKIAFSNSLALEFIAMLSIGLIALEVAVRLIIFQDISFFTGFLMLVLAPEFYTKLKDLGSAFHTGRTSMGAAKKLEGELAISEGNVVWGERSLAATAGPPTIELKDAGFSYGDSAFKLKDINLRIRPYEQIAVIGKSGSGKSTLLNMVAGLLPLSEGKVLADGIPLTNLKESDWFGRLSYISQNPYLFSGTLRENIAIGMTDTASEDEIRQAAERAGLHDLVSMLPNGFETRVGEAGRGLSGGEKQRIAIARAFLKRPSIVLFDEPTTGLDLKTEQILQDSIKELAKTSTIVTVAHRLHTIRNADRILLLEDGILAAAGTHSELLDSNEMYRQMITVQQGGVWQ